MTEMPKATVPSGAEPAIDPALQIEDRQHDEDNLDEAIEETFPASDPIAPSHIS